MLTRVKSRRLLRSGAAIAALLCGLLTTGCSDDDGISPEDELVGDYELYTYAGDELPVAVGSGVTMLSGTLRMEADGSSVMTFTLYMSSLVTQEYHFTYTLEGDALTLEGEYSGVSVVLTGTFAAGTITLLQQGVDPSHVFVFKRVCTC